MRRHPTRTHFTFPMPLQTMISGPCFLDEIHLLLSSSSVTSGTYIRNDWPGLVVWSVKVKSSEMRRTIKGPKSLALTSLSRHDIHQCDPSSVRCSLLTFCQLSPAVSSWGPCQRTEGGRPKFPTLQIIPVIFKDCKINHPQSCNFTSKSRKSSQIMSILL